jgi:hypothetical protein
MASVAAYCLLLTAYCLLLTAYCLLLTAYRSLQVWRIVPQFSQISLHLRQTTRVEPQMSHVGGGGSVGAGDDMRR